MTTPPPPPGELDPSIAAVITIPGGQQVQVTADQAARRRIEVLQRAAFEAIDRESQALASVDALAATLAEEQRTWAAERDDLLAQIGRLQASLADTAEPAEAAEAPAEHAEANVVATSTRRRRETSADALGIADIAAS